MDQQQSAPAESPAHVRMSLAAAMTLGFKSGIFYRGAKLHCINLLLTYRGGCAARCAYCGLSSLRAGRYSQKSFIRVTWPTYPLDEIARRIARRQNRVKRICISQITNPRAVADTQEICRRLRSHLDIPISVLISPTITTRQHLAGFRAAGADKIGVAIDLATPELFDRFRGQGVGGPHRWETYLQRLAEAIEIFGRRNAGAHFMTGMGETEKQMVDSMQRIQDMGGCTHLFSFFPEAGSRMSTHPMPAMDHYRRIQLARYLIDEKLSRAARFGYDRQQRVVAFGLDRFRLDAIIDSGQPFRTSGCEGSDGEVACNRPYGNCRPGNSIRNFPFPPTANDVRRIRRQMGMNIR